MGRCQKKSGQGQQSQLALGQLTLVPASAALCADVGISRVHLNRKLKEFGAEWGVGVGMTGQCYAIPTMDGSIDIIRKHVDDFTACICLKKVDSQKESIIMTPHTEFQKKYYQQVIEIHQKTGFSPRKIAKLQLVPVSVRQMYHWIAIFEAENGKGSPRRIMEAKKSKEQAELESLKSRISELEESLRVERLRNRLNEKIIDIAEARWHIEIRKKAGTKR